MKLKIQNQQAKMNASGQNTNTLFNNTDKYNFKSKSEVKLI